MTAIDVDIIDPPSSPQSNGQSGPPPELQKGDEFSTKVKKRWKEGTDALTKQRREHWVNLAFFEGDQWIWWDTRRNTLQGYAKNWSPLGPGRAKVVVNRIQFNLQSLLSRLIKSDLGWNVPPSTADDGAVEGAKLAEKVLQALQRHDDWDAIRFDELFAMQMGGTSAVSIEWDPTAGEPLEYDQETNKVTATGEPVLQAHDITEFCLEPGVRDYKKARWWMSGIALPCEYAQEHYGLSWTPSADASASMSSMQHKLLDQQGRAAGKNLTLVLTYYERPHAGKKGEFGVVINGVTVHKGPWPFPFERLNLAVFRDLKINGRWWGNSMMQSARPLQFAYNHARSILAEHMKLTGNARLMAPSGAFDEEDFTDDPGSIVWYTPDLNNAKPEYLVPPQLPRWMIQEADTIAQELDDIMHVHAVSRGMGYPRASAQALAFLSEKDDSPLALMATEQRHGWAAIATMVLELMEAKATETRTRVLPIAPGISESVQWNGQMLRGQTTADVDPDSVMPHSTTAREAFAKDLWDRQILTDPRRYARMVGLEPEQFEELLDADAAKAQRENYRMEQGRVEVPEQFDDHGVHMSEHNRFRKSDAYKYADPQIRQLFDQHILMHENVLHEEYARQVQRAMQNPALAALPQGHEPLGAQMPPDSMEARAAQMQQAVGGQPALGAGPQPPNPNGEGGGGQAGGQQPGPAQSSEIQGRGRQGGGGGEGK